MPAGEQLDPLARDVLARAAERLSARERHIVEGLAAGCCIKALAAELGLHRVTVSGYILRARRKFGAKDTYQLMYLYGRAACVSAA